MCSNTFAIFATFNCGFATPLSSVLLVCRELNFSHDWRVIRRVASIPVRSNNRSSDDFCLRLDKGVVDFFDVCEALKPAAGTYAFCIRMQLAERIDENNWAFGQIVGFAFEVKNHWIAFIRIEVSCNHKGIFVPSVVDSLGN